MSGQALTQKARFMRIYRRTLKDTLSWVFSRDVWYKEVASVRAEFQKIRKAPEPAVVDALLAKQEAKLANTYHPNPYIVPYVFGGSLYARNPPVPKEIKIHKDFGRVE